ncbi:hypothetical protein GQ457_18G005120 [Hibiscus cannabinus]
MNPYDTTNVLFSKIKDLDPENAYKIMGYILIQDLADRDLLRLAFGPENPLALPCFHKAKAHLGLSSNTFSTHLNPISRPNASNNSQNPSSIIPYYSRTGDSNTDLVHENQMSDYFSFLNDSSSSKNDDLIGHRRSFSERMMRMRAASHQQRLAAAQLMAGVSSPFPYETNMSLLLQRHTEAQRAAALMLGEEICKFAPGRRSEMNEYSTFKDEDVANYFSMFGPVQDVRIPYQQKRMFGFVTFVHPETVKQILARGNPHYICDSRVLVKPYKEKGKRQYLQQQLERGDFSSCSSPLGLDCREPYDPHVGKQANIVFLGKDVLQWSRDDVEREFEEQADLQHAIELQRRRLVNLQLPDFKNDGIHRHHRSLSVGVSVSLPAYSHDSQNVHPSDSIKQQVSKSRNVGGKKSGFAVVKVILFLVAVNGGNTAPPPVTMNAAEEEDLNSACVQKGGVGSPKGCHGSSIEHALPDSPFASPEKSTETHLSEFPVLVEANGNPNLCAVSTSENDSLLLVSSTSNMAPI